MYILRKSREFYKSSFPGLIADVKAEVCLEYTIRIECADFGIMELANRIFGLAL